MTARRREGSGRTTPKGTAVPKKKTRRSRTAGSAPAGAPREIRAGKVGRTPAYVARPDSHSRGNR